MTEEDWGMKLFFKGEHVRYMGDEGVICGPYVKCTDKYLVRILEVEDTQNPIWIKSEELELIR